jgi:insertion element IS1 protein InsB
VLGDDSAQTFQPLWDEAVSKWKCYFYVTDWWPVYPMFIPDGDQTVSKTNMTRVEGENTRLRHYLARPKRKTLCYSKSTQMVKHSIRLLIHYFKFVVVASPWRIECQFPNQLIVTISKGESRSKLARRLAAVAKPCLNPAMP